MRVIFAACIPCMWCNQTCPCANTAIPCFHNFTEPGPCLRKGGGGGGTFMSYLLPVKRCAQFSGLQMHRGSRMHYACLMHLFCLYNTFDPNLFLAWVMPLKVL